MAPHDESMPLIGKYGSGKLKPSQPGVNKLKRVSSISQELGPETLKGTSSLLNVGINLAKTAAGTGILALPYACKQGGLVLFVFGMFLIAFWNVYCMKQLCDALEYLLRLGETPNMTAVVYVDTEDPTTTNCCDCCTSHCRHDRFSIKYRDPPPDGTSSFSKLGWYAMGDLGLWSIDLMMLMLLSFINIAFEVAILSFAQATPFTTGVKLYDGLILGLLLVPLCIVDDLSALSKLSRLGLIILGVTMSVIGCYGIKDRFFDNDVDQTSASDNLMDTDTVFRLYPLNGIEGISKWFGCIVFSFGIVPLTFNFRESMAEPEKLPKTALISMFLVGICYNVIGLSFLYLFPNIENDLLAEIPSTGFLATTTRLAMILVTMATTPLLTVPCAEIIEGKILNITQGEKNHTQSRKLMVITRTFVLMTTVTIAAKLPGFVSVLSFVGCFAVSMVSFVLPPGLHCLLLGQGFDDGQTEYSTLARMRDVSMLLIGLATTIITTWFTGA
jgi:amino acid permease